MTEKLKVLFLCTGNSCRSQMAEGWARHLRGDSVEPYWAGVATHGLNTDAVKVMAEAGVDISGHRSKHVNDLKNVRFDYVVRVCDQANESCPVFPGKAKLTHVGFDDPPALAKRAKSEEEALGHYRRVRDEIRAFVESLPESLHRDQGRSAGAGEARGGPATQDTAKKRLSFFERYLTLWVAACMVVGVAIGKLLPGLTDPLRRLEFGEASQINVPIAVLIWLMIYPMMLKIDFTSILNVRRRPRGLLVTLFVNWLVKPFSMAFLGWLFFKHVFFPWIGAEAADQYIAGTIILAAAPCTAMVFVWSYLTDGDPAYTLVQVSVNDLIMLVAFAPIVTFLVSGASNLTVPFDVLLWSVVAFIVIPLALGSLSRVVAIRVKGQKWFEERFLATFHPVTILEDAMEELLRDWDARLRLASSYTS